MGQRAVLGAVVGMILALVAGCAGFSREQKAYAPHINPADFSTTTIDNEYFPLKPGTTFVYQGNRVGTTRDEMAVTHSTKKVMGVECVVVDDRGYEAGKLIEGIFD
jgi:hypothetical protein